ncbi:MAG TPA: hypothetical protein VIV14_05715 [Gammaproteobacteria bacterium]
MSNKPSPELSGTFVFSDEAMEEMENLESTEVMQVLAEFTEDHDATEVIDDDIVGDLMKP